MKNEIKVFSGNGNPELARAICHYLHLPVGESSSIPSSHRSSPAAGIERKPFAAGTFTKSTPTCAPRPGAVIHLRIALVACCFTPPSMALLMRNVRRETEECRSQ